MAGNDELVNFVRDALSKNIPRQQIGEALAEAGWSTAQVSSALAAFSETAFPVPVPRPRPYVDAREAFIYLLLFTTLYLAVINFGDLVFVLIERSFPLPGQDAPQFRERIRGPLAILIVSLPVFVYMSWVVAREIRQDPARRVSEIRRKLTYLTLFISAAVAIGVVAGVIYGALGGELTSRFALKAATALALAGLVFWYYSRDLNLDPTELRPG